MTLAPGPCSGGAEGRFGRAPSELARAPWLCITTQSESALGRMDTVRAINSVPDPNPSWDPGLLPSALQSQLWCLAPDLTFPELEGILQPAADT